MGGDDRLVRRGRAGRSSAEGLDEGEAAAGSVVDELVRVLGGSLAEDELEEAEEFCIILVAMEGVEDVLGPWCQAGRELEHRLFGECACRHGGGDAYVDDRAELGEVVAVDELAIDVGDARE